MNEPKGIREHIADFKRQHPIRARYYLFMAGIKLRIEIFWHWLTGKDIYL